MFPGEKHIFVTIFLVLSNIFCSNTKQQGNLRIMRSRALRMHRSAQKRAAQLSGSLSQTPALFLPCYDPCSFLSYLPCVPDPLLPSGRPIFLRRHKAFRLKRKLLRQTLYTYRQP